ncbi:hypothetical protein V8C86DRAFT_3172026 [Haematococcus lacustris]
MTHGRLQTQVTAPRGQATTAERAPRMKPRLTLRALAASVCFKAGARVYHGWLLARSEVRLVSNCSRVGRVRHDAEETPRDRYDFSISAGDCTGPPAARLSQLRLVAYKAPNGRKLGQTRVDTSAQHIHMHKHKPITFRTHLRRALHVSAATMHERRLVQLVLQGKEDRGLSAVFEAWLALASWELDLSLFTRADGPCNATFDLEASAVGPQPTRLMITISSCPSSQALKNLAQAAAAAAGAGGGEQGQGPGLEGGLDISVPASPAARSMLDSTFAGQGLTPLTQMSSSNVSVAGSDTPSPLPSLPPPGDLLPGTVAPSPPHTSPKAADTPLDPPHPPPTPTNDQEGGVDKLLPDDVKGAGREDGPAGAALAVAGVGAVAAGAGAAVGAGLAAAAGVAVGAGAVVGAGLAVAAGAAAGARAAPETSPPPPPPPLLLLVSSLTWRAGPATVVMPKIDEVASPKAGSGGQAAAGEQGEQLGDAEAPSTPPQGTGLGAVLPAVGAAGGAALGALAAGVAGVAGGAQPRELSSRSRGGEDSSPAPVARVSTDRVAPVAPEVVPVPGAAPAVAAIDTAQGPLVLQALPTNQVDLDQFLGTAQAQLGRWGQARVWGCPAAAPASTAATLGTLPAGDLGPFATASAPAGPPDSATALHSAVDSPPASATTPIFPAAGDRQAEQPGVLHLVPPTTVSGSNQANAVPGDRVAAPDELITSPAHGGLEGRSHSEAASLPRGGSLGDVEGRGQGVKGGGLGAMVSAAAAAAAGAVAWAAGGVGETLSSNPSHPAELTPQHQPEATPLADQSEVTPGSIARSVTPTSRLTEEQMVEVVGPSEVEEAQGGWSMVGAPAVGGGVLVAAHEGGRTPSLPAVHGLGVYDVLPGAMLGQGGLGAAAGAGAGAGGAERLKREAEGAALEPAGDVAFADKPLNSPHSKSPNLAQAAASTLAVPVAAAAAVTHASASALAQPLAAATAAAGQVVKSVLGRGHGEAEDGAIQHHEQQPAISSASGRGEKDVDSSGSGHAALGAGGAAREDVLPDNRKAAVHPIHQFHIGVAPSATEPTGVAIAHRAVLEPVPAPVTDATPVPSAAETPAARTRTSFRQAARNRFASLRQRFGARRNRSPAGPRQESNQESDGERAAGVEHRTKSDSAGAAPSWLNADNVLRAAVYVPTAAVGGGLGILLAVLYLLAEARRASGNEVLETAEAASTRAMPASNPQGNEAGGSEQGIEEDGGLTAKSRAVAHGLAAKGGALVDKVTAKLAGAGDKIAHALGAGGHHHSDNPADRLVYMADDWDVTGAHNRGIWRHKRHLVVVEHRGEVVGPAEAAQQLDHPATSIALQQKVGQELASLVARHNQGCCTVSLHHAYSMQHAQQQQQEQPDGVVTHTTAVAKQQKHQVSECVIRSKCIAVLGTLNTVVVCTAAIMAHPYTVSGTSS